MLHLKIHKKDGSIVDIGRFSSQESMNEWIKAHTSQEVFGKNAYTEKVEVSPSVKNDLGVEIIPAIYETIEHPNEYTPEVIDVSLEVEQERINMEAKAYLAETDWLIIRDLETGKKPTKEILDKRAEARTKVK